MKKLLCTSVAGLLIGSAMPAFAASTTVLAVQGTITPSACTPSLSANTIDVGQIPVKDLDQDNRTLLPTATLQMNIDCEASTLFAFKATDNRLDSIDAGVYGLGKTSAGESIGGYTMFLDKGVADLAPVYMISSINNGATWFRLWGDDVWQKNSIISIQDPGATRVPIPARNTVVELSVKPFINPAKNLTLTDDTPIDGSVTMEVAYL